MIHDTWADSEDPIALELHYGGTWHDVTDKLSEAGVSIDRRSGEPAELTCTLNNADGLLSPRNPSSPLWGQAGRNTPIRCTVTLDSTTRVLFSGEVSEWLPRVTIKGTAYVPIKAAGPRRRLGQGDAPLQSVYRRACTSPTAPVEGLVLYLPMEDGAGSTQFASGLPGLPAARIDGAPQLASDSDAFPCSAPLPVFSSDFAAGAVVAPYEDTGEWQAMFLIYLPAGKPAAKTRILGINTDSPSCAAWNVSVDNAGNLYLDVFAMGGSTTYSVYSYLGVEGAKIRLYLSAQDDGSGGVDWTLASIKVGETSGVYIDGNIAGATPGRPVWWVAAPDHGLDGCVGGHATVQSVVTSIFLLAWQLAAWTGEGAADRVERLLGEAGVTATIVGGGSGTPMGYQRSARLLELLDACAATDLGYLSDTADELGMTYRTRAATSAQDPALELTWAEGLLSPFEPAEDDTTRNRITITRDGGSSATWEQTSGPLSTAPPPDGVGTYEDAVTLSLPDDGTTLEQASWRVHERTVDEARWPRIGIDLAHPSLRAAPSLAGDVLDLALGDRVLITGCPDDISHWDVDQLVEGLHLQITPARFKVELDCRPYSPRAVGVWAAEGATTGTLWRPGPATLSGDHASSATHLYVDVVGTPLGYLADYDVLVDGKRFTVTGVTTPPSGPQVLDVTPADDGVSRTLLDGTAVEIVEPSVWSLPL
jgi:hypothetical protein